MGMWQRLFRRKLFRRLLVGGLGLVLAGSVAALTLPSIFSGESRATPEVVKHPPSPTAKDPAETPRGDTLTVLTLNVAHGRGAGRHQMLQGTRKIRSNLDTVASLLERVGPDVAALQEADGPAFWSGRFSHVEYLATKAGFEFSCHGLHVAAGKTSYGTALLSSRPLEDSLSITFEPTPPTLSKGFIVCALDWPGDPGLRVDLVSVHLDFSRRSVRHRQVKTMITELKPRKRPLIILGDFNCDWKREDSALRLLARGLDLTAHRPEASDLPTFPEFQRRLDWILISGEFHFEKHEVLPDVVSDHRAVVAEIGIRESGDDGESLIQREGESREDSHGRALPESSRPSRRASR